MASRPDRVPAPLKSARRPLGTARRRTQAERTEETRTRLWPTEELREQLLRRIPLRRFGREEEVAHACAYLVSDYAGYVTGDVLTLDGGAWLEQGMFKD